MVTFLGGYVVKKFDSCKKAKYFSRLYNSFPNHVKSFTFRNFLIYRYSKGETLEKLILSKKDISEVMINLSKKMNSIHFNNYKIIKNYKQVCLDRELYKKKRNFKDCYSYYSVIHGDLNPRNIIIDEEKITFIDRLSEKGDIMFDFTFIINMLCIKYTNNDKSQIKYIKIFFENYLKGIKNKTNFYDAFTNNIFNYLYFIYYSNYYKSLPFEEWKEIPRIMIDLEKSKNFEEFLDKNNLI